MYRLDTSIRDTALVSAVWMLDQNAAEEGRARMSSQRSGVLELAVLGLLHETPMHGYELRKRLNSVLGAFRAFGYGSLYPCLKELLRQGLIAEEVPAAAAKSLAGRRSGMLAACQTSLRPPCIRGSNAVRKKDRSKSLT